MTRRRAGHLNAIQAAWASIQVISMNPPVSPRPATGANGFCEVVDMLVAAGADLAIQNLEGQTAADLAHTETFQRARAREAFVCLFVFRRFHSCVPLGIKDIIRCGERTSMNEPCHPAVKWFCSWPFRRKSVQ